MKQTKRFLLAVIALAILMISNSNASDSPAKAQGSSQEKTAVETSAQSQDTDLKEQVAELKRLVQSQQGRIEKLESDLKSAHENTPLGQVGTEFTAKPKVEAAPQQTQQALGKGSNGPEAKANVSGPLAFSGDIRLRHESFFGGGNINAAEPADRHRERIRLRFNTTARLNDEVSGGFTLASGDLGDPISTNSTETGFFTRKPIAIDRAWTTYHPRFF